MHTPGHTPACMSYKIGDACSSATRCSCRTTARRAAIFRAAMRARFIARSSKLLALPAKRACSSATITRRRVAMHMRGKPPLRSSATSNIHVREGIGEDEFVAMREARDKTLEMPALILPSIQVNIRAGELAAGGGQRRALSEAAARRALGCTHRGVEQGSYFVFLETVADALYRAALAIVRRSNGGSDARTGIGGDCRVRPGGMHAASHRADGSGAGGARGVSRHCHWRLQRLPYAYDAARSGHGALAAGRHPHVRADDRNSVGAYAPPIAGGPAAYTDEQFAAFLQTGVRPDGSMARPPMPQFRLNEEDARAVVAYIKTVPPAP